MTTRTTPPDRPNLTEIVSRAQFVPTAMQCRRREEFWAGNPQVPADADLAAVLSLGAHRAISRWWSIPGFEEWFLDKDWNKHEAESLLHVAMQKLASVMLSSSDNAELLQAAKEARTLHAQLTASDKEDDKFADEDINRMSEKELDEFLAKNSGMLQKNS